MNGSVSDGVDGEIRAALVRGDEDAAVARAIEGYGPEVLGFLVAVLRDDDAADDVFSMFCEDVWRGLTHVRSANALRAWVYTVARHAAARYRRAAYESRRKPLSCAPLAVLEARARTRTQTFLRSETRSAVDRLREQLAPDDRALLILRLDRGLPWNEIAAIMADENSSSADGFRKDAAAWRKRFERVKDRLRKMAESAGLLRDDE